MAYFPQGYPRSFLEAVMQDDGSRPGPGGAVRCQPVVPAPDRWKLVDLGLPAQQDLPDQLQLRVPALGGAGVVHSGKLDELGDRLGATGVPGHPDGEAGVAVEDQLAAGEVADELVPQRHQLVLGEDPHQAMGDEDGWPAGGNGVQPVLLGDVGADNVRVGALWEQALS